MTREFIINELVARGIKAEATEVTKNGVVLEGIMVGEGSVRPTIYADFYKNASENMIEELVEHVKEILEEAPQFVTEDLTNWDWAKTRLRLCIQQKGNEPICKRDFLDLEQYVRVVVDEEQGASFKVSPAMLEKYGVSEYTLFHVAMDCTRPLIEVQDMSSIIADMMGISVDEVIEMQGENPPMIVVTNKSKVNGASTICFMDVLKEVADRYEKDLVILPSSIHECILHPMDDTINFTTFNEMVQNVNENEVDPVEVLSNHVYVYSITENKIFVSLKEYAKYLEHKSEFMQKVIDNLGLN